MHSEGPQRGDEFERSTATATEAPAAETAAAPPSVEHRAAMTAWSAAQVGAPVTAPVQAHADGHRGAMSTWSAEQGAAAATRSVEGASSPLPHGDTIQAAFGGHDVSGVRAEIGGGAGDAARAIGATAFATGDRVGFAEAPDLHTAAHEAAHVVQQRQGIVQYKGLGHADDPHERHADRVADAVVAGQSAAPLLGEIQGGGTLAGGVSGAVQRKGPDEPGAIDTALGLFKAGAIPADPLVAVEVAAGLPPELATGLGIAPQVSASMVLAVDAAGFQLAVTVGGTTLVAAIDFDKVLAVLAGPAGAQAAELLPKATEFMTWAKGRFTAAGSGRVKIHVWGDAADASFVVIDVMRAVRGAQQGSASGLRPVEARLVTKAGRVEQFAGDQVKAREALPTTGKLGTEPITAPALRRTLLGLDDEAPVYVSAYYADRKIAFAVTGDEAATTGVVAEIDLGYLADRLAKLGEKVGHLLKSFRDRLAEGAHDLLKWARGLMRFELGGGSFFEFDFHALLPRLGGGGGFDLGGLWPTSWSFDLPGLKLGVLPKLKLDWLQWPTVKTFDFDLSRLTGLFANLGLPALPKLPSGPLFDFKLDGLQLGFALDLGKLWPDLEWGEGGPSTFGVKLDLAALLRALQSAGGAIGRAAAAIYKKLAGAVDRVKQWVHVGGDGVIRIYDGKAADPSKTSMLGFSLLRLLDGVEATDLAPVEIRYHGDDADLELGAAVAPDADAAETAKAREEGAASPQRPKAPLIDQDDVALPASVITTLGLAPGATGYLSIAGDPPRLIAYAEAKSGHRDGLEGLRMSLDLERLVAKIKKLLPPPSGRAPRLPMPHFGGVKIGDDAAIELRLGEKAADGEPPVPYARAAWKISKLIGAQDLGALEPEEFALEAPGTAALVRGPFTAPDGLIGDRFAIPAPSVRKDLLHVDDGGDDVYLGVYYAEQMFSLTATPTKDKDEGLLGQVNVVKLLEQLKRLGALGERMLDVLGRALGATLDGARSFADKVGRIAAKIGRGVLDVVDRVLRIKLPTLAGGGGGGWIGWDLSRLAPNISLSGFSLDGILPDFEGISLPGLPGLSMSWLPDNPFSGGNPLGGIAWPAIDLKKLISGIGVDLPSLRDVNFGFDVFGLDGLGLGVSLDLSFLDKLVEGLGAHKLSLQIDLAAILKPFEKAWAWLSRKFGGKLKKGDSKLPNVALGGDGVLRLWDDEAHIGFQLTRLLDGFQPADIVPVEMQFHVTTGGGKSGTPETELASFEYGRVVDGAHPAPATPLAGQVLAERPDGTTMASARFPAPELVRQHLGAPEGAQISASLIQAGDDAALFATVSGTDRGMVIRIDRAKLAALSAKIGGQSTASIDGGVQILWKESKAAGGIVIGFGDQPKAGTKQQDVKPHGHAMWRLHRFFDGLDLGDLVPDEARYERAEGGFAVGVGLDVSGLKKVADFDVPASPSWIQAAVGERAEIYANASEKQFRVALTSEGATPGAPRRGIELDVAEWFLDEAEKVVADKVKAATTAVGNVMKKTQRAGAAVGGQLTERRISLETRASGLRLQRGKDGDADHLYATFGWSNLVDVVSKGDLSGLIPTEFRIATTSVALEVEDLALESGATMPKDAKRVGGMHAMFRDTLTTFGLAESDFLDLDLGKSPIQELGDGTHNVNLVGRVFTPKDALATTDDHAEGVAVQSAKQVTLSVSLEALLAQVLPRQRKFADPKKPKPKKGTHLSLGFKRDIAPGQDGEQAGIELGLSSVHQTKKGPRTVELHAGWTAEKLLNILMNLDDIITEDGKPGDVAGLLTPDVIGGSFSNHLFKVNIENRGERVGDDVRVGDLPLLPDILAGLVDQKTADETRLWLKLPGAPELASQFGKSLLAGEYMPVAQAAIDMPGAAYPIAINLALSLSFLERLAGLIPYVGVAIKIIRGVQGLVTNPKETVENLIYEPELFMHAFENAGEIYDKLKSMSWKDAALIMMSNDASTKQLVYAARLKKRLKAAGVTLPDGKKGGEMPSAEELAWLAKQDPHAIEKAVAVEAKLAELGLLVDEERPPATGKLDVKDLEALEATINAGFTEFAQARQNAQKAPDDPAAQAAAAAAAEKFRKAVAARIAAGAKKQESDHEPTTTDPDKLPDGAPAPEGDEALVDLKDLPAPDADQLALAQSMWKDSKQGYDPTHQAYLIQKFGFLTIDQLATLLERGVVTVTAASGPKALPMFESERPYVQELFVVMARKSGWEPKPAAPGAPGSTSAELVQSWRQRNQQAADQAKKDQRAADRADVAARSGGDAGRSGSGGGGSGGDAEVEESLDDALWDEEREHDERSSGGGATGDGLDLDGDGELSAEELKGPKPAEGEGGEHAEGGEHEGEADGGGTAPAEPAKIDDERLWNLNSGIANGMVTWDAAAGALTKNQARIDEILANTKGTQTTSKGEQASLTSIEVTIGGDFGKNTKMIEYQVVLVSTAPSGTIRSAPYVYYYDVSESSSFETTGGAAVIAAVHDTFIVENGVGRLRGDKTLIINRSKFEVIQVGHTYEIGGGYMIEATLKAVAVRPGARVMDRSGKYVNVVDGDEIEMKIPYVKEQ
jgi:hypothetical protein